MELRILNKAETKALYNSEMKRAFPPSELKPLSAIEDMRDKGRYEPLGLYEGEELPEDFVCPLCKHGAADFEPIQ